MTRCRWTSCGLPSLRRRVGCSHSPGRLAVPTTDMLAPPVKAATYNNTLFAAPYTSDAGLLYYRSDLVPNPPTTWDEMMADCPIAQQNGMGCYAGQFFKYEGLTVNASEAINTGGGRSSLRTARPRPWIRRNRRRDCRCSRTTTRTATSRRRRSPSRRRIAGSLRGREAAVPAELAVRVQVWPRPMPRHRSSGSSAWRHCRAHVRQAGRVVAGWP